jgi:RNA polymerase sigma-70 factor, ECF subfamily
MSTVPEVSGGSAVETSERVESTLPGAPVASADDLALIARLLARDETAFEQLVARHHGTLLRLARVFVTDSSAAEETVQETWLAVLNGLRSFEARSSLKTWIFQILVNKAKSRGVRERRSVPFSALVDADADEPAVDPSHFRPDGTWRDAPARWDDRSPERLLMAQESRAKLQEVIDTLPAAQRAVLTLRDIEGLDSVEVCNALAISETNQRVLLHRARARVRAALDQFVSRK